MISITGPIDFTSMSQEEIISHLNRIQQEHESAQQEIAQLRRQEALRQEEEELKDAIRKEKRFIPIRNTLVLRRTPNHKKIAPARDVLDYATIYDLKDVHTPQGKKTKVTDDEIKAYQLLRSEGAKDVTVSMIAERVKMEPKYQSLDHTEEEEDSPEMED